MPAAQTVADVDLAQVDLFDPAWFEEGPPYELFARMRRETPVRWNPLPEGSGADGVWCLTRHADCAKVSRDFRTFSSARAGVFPHPDQVMPLDVARNLLLFKDPPDHTKFRQILQTAFTPHSVAKLEDAVRERVTRVIDEFVERGACDITRDVAIPIPLGVLCSLMGLPEEDVPQILAWGEEIGAAQRAAEPAAATETFGVLAGYLQTEIQKQLDAGVEDSLVMRLRRAEVDGEQLTEWEILTFFGLLIFAGHDTTRNTTAAGMLQLLRHPDQLQELVDDPSLIPAAIEEMIRTTTVVQWFARTATCDTEVAGTPIAEGQKVVMWYGAASRDEDVFEDPERFDIHREKPDHHGFGSGGRHFCLGAGLARLELRVIFEELTRRLRDVRPAGEPQWLRTNWAHAVTSLPVAFTPGPREGG